MINLLPPDVKENFFYARRNVLLRRWLVGIVLGAAGIALLIGGGAVLLRQAVKGYAMSNTATHQPKDQAIGLVQKQVDDISNNLKLSTKVLSREILFSSLLTQIGTALPHGAVLTALDITQPTGGLDLQVATTDFQTASQVQVNLADPTNKIFSKADIVSIQCQATGNGGIAFSDAYPCKLQIRAQFASNNSFFLTHDAKGAKQ